MSPTVRPGARATQRVEEKLRTEIVDLRRQVGELTATNAKLVKRLDVLARDKAELTERVEQLHKLTRRRPLLGGKRHTG